MAVAFFAGGGPTNHSSKLIQSVCQCFRIVVLSVSNRVDRCHMPG